MENISASPVGEGHKVAGFKQTTSGRQIPTQGEIESAYNAAEKLAPPIVTMNGTRCPLSYCSLAHVRPQTEFRAPDPAGAPYRVAPIYGPNGRVSDILWFGSRAFTADDWFAEYGGSHEPWLLTTGRAAVLNQGALSQSWARDNRLKVFASPSRWADDGCTGVMVLREDATRLLRRAEFLQCDDWEHAARLAKLFVRPDAVVGPQDRAEIEAHVYAETHAAMRQARLKRERLLRDAAHGPDLAGHLRFEDGVLHEWQRKRGKDWAGTVAESGK